MKTNRPSRGRLVLLAALPLAFVAIFFVYPLARILVEGLAPDGSFDLARDARGAGSAVRHRSCLVHALAGGRLDRPDRARGDARRVRVRPLRFPGATGDQRRGAGAVRSAHGRRRGRVRGADRPARTVASGCGSTTRSGRSCSPTSSTTTPSCCASSAARGAQLDPRLEEAARALGRHALAGLPAGDAAAPAAGDRIRLVDRLPVHLHVVRA